MKGRTTIWIRRAAAIAIMLTAGLGLAHGTLADNSTTPTAPYQLNSASNAQCPTSGCIGKPHELGIPIVGTGNAISSAVDILSLLAGILSVIFIVLGGIRLTTSSGDSARAATARQTILFAVIGLAISLIAPLVVAFVIVRGPS